MRTFLALFFVGLCALGLSGQEERAKASARFVPETARAGDKVVLEVTFVIQEGYHVYGRKESTGQATGLSFDAAGGLKKEGEAEIPDGDLHVTMGVEGWWIAGKAVLRQAFVVPAGVTGAVEVKGTVDYMACTEEFCEPPAKAPFAARLAVAAGAAPAAQEPKVPSRPSEATKEPKLSVQAAFRPARAAPGAKVTLELTATVIPGWHVYGGSEPHSVKTSFALQEAAGLVAAGDPVVPPGEKHEIVADSYSYWLAGTFVMSQEFTVPAQARPGPATVRGAIEYMPCTENFCLAVETLPFTAQLDVAQGAAAAPVTSSDDDGIGGGSLLQLLLAAVGAGLLALAMPCTYPMIPITISFFTKQASVRGGSALPLALLYGAGIVLMFVLIGVVVGPGIIPFATHWLTNLIIAVVFVVFALSLFGVITLEPPRFLMDAASRASGVGGPLGVFLMGTTLVVTSFTCTVPFVATLLAFAAKTGGLGQLALGMAVFGLTMAVPFVFLALMPGRVKAMPRSGEWMDTLKVFLGFVEVAAALKFFSNVDMVTSSEPPRALYLSRELFLLLWAVTFAVAGTFLLGLVRLRGKASEGVGPGQMLGGLASMLFAGYCFFGAQGNQLDWVMSAIAPPTKVAGESAGAGNGTRPKQSAKHAIVVDDWPGALAKAKEARRLVLANFTGFT
ncbi:MAG: hypothetical protein IT458_13015 [Planctomycetes bacterium]|nr:hypothetical protein [Planctomycetota bacterium]